MDQPENELVSIVVHHKPLANKNHQNCNEIFAIFFGSMGHSYIHICLMFFLMFSE